MTDSLRIAHCSDIHLDGDHYHHDQYVEASDYYRESFEKVLAEMRGHNPDIMLLAGDLFTRIPQPRRPSSGRCR